MNFTVYKLHLNKPDFKEETLPGSESQLWLVALGRSFTSSLPQFPHLYNGDNNSTYFIGFL